MIGKPLLIVMAAGMASRYGGLKQIEKMTEAGEIILDFSLYDAMRAGFQKALFVIRKEHRELFRPLVDERVGRFMEIDYAYQDLTDIPEGFSVPEGREKPWGTGHAIYACRDRIDGPFAVINADDYYGPQGFRDIYEFLKDQPDHTEDGRINICMSGYLLGNTVSESGRVTRGLCRMDGSRFLTGIREQKNIIRRPEGVSYTEDDGESWVSLPEDTVVSMNFWGYPQAMSGHIEAGLRRFLSSTAKTDPLRGEYLLPTLVGEMIGKGEGSVSVLPCQEQWCGVTYQADREDVRIQLENKKSTGLYPAKLWDGDGEGTGTEKATVLLTGGAGYIGSHTAVEMIRAGYRVVIADNYINSSPEVIGRIGKITGTEPAAYAVDVASKEQMERVFAENRIDAVIHFAGLKAVGESTEKPLQYYRNNLDTVLTVLELMKKYGCGSIVFSSSATVYGSENPVPYVETMPKGSCTNPYGWTKSMIEQILVDTAAADEDLSVVLLRYFNPIGADESGLIGEDPQGIPNNLMPFISQVAVGRRDHLTVFGDDYPTPDGTCRRDYIHVSDLAEGHVKAVEHIMEHRGTEVFNLGTGTPYSVLEIVHAFEKANDIRIPYEIGPRRAGDLPEFWANADKAADVLGWTTKRSLEKMCRDAWNWQKKNPRGYGQR